MVNNRMVTAKLDSLYKYDGKWYILDFKTESVQNISDSAKKYRYQMEVYGLAAGRNLKLDSITAELLFLESNETFSFNINLSEAEVKTANLISEIEKFDFESFNKTKKSCNYCGTCGYLSICHKNTAISIT